MSLFTFNTSINFQEVVEAIDQATPADVTSSSNWFFFKSYTFSIGDGLTVSMNVFPYNFFGLVQSTSFVITDDATGEVAGQFTLLDALDFSGGIGLADAIQAIDYDTPNYISSDSGAVIEGYGTDDEMLGQGTFYGNDGNDKIELEGSSANPLGNAETSAAYGGNGDDTIEVATQNADVDGGAGDDTIVVRFGDTVNLSGGGRRRSFCL